MITWGLLITVESPALPKAIIPYGAAGGFLLLAGAALLLLPFVFWLLPPKKSEEENVQKENVWLALRSAPNRRLALTAMFALFIYEIGQGGVDTLTGLIGEEAGMDKTAVGWAFFGAEQWAFWVGSWRPGWGTGLVSFGPS